jgi:hypothetical protein
MDSTGTDQLTEDEGEVGNSKERVEDEPRDVIDRIDIVIRRRRNLVRIVKGDGRLFVRVSLERARSSFGASRERRALVGLLARGRVGGVRVKRSHRGRMGRLVSRGSSSVVGRLVVEHPRPPEPARIKLINHVRVLARLFLLIFCLSRLPPRPAALALLWTRGGRGVGKGVEVGGAVARGGV